MRRALKWLGIGFLSIVAGIQGIQPDRSNPASSPSGGIGAHLNVPEPVERILRRSCYDCHSHQTRWPWYSYIAPVSFFVSDHVSHGRSHLNFSDWEQISSHGGRQDQRQKLEAICRETSNGQMPLRSYLLLHPGARLSPADVRILCDWAGRGSRRP